MGVFERSDHLHVLRVGQAPGELLRVGPGDSATIQGAGYRVVSAPMPPLTEERRKDLVKVARKSGEECKVAIRKARHDAKDMIDSLQKEGEVGEDDADRARKELEEVVKGGTNKVDEIVGKKETDILEV